MKKITITTTTISESVLVKAFSRLTKDDIKRITTEEKIDRKRALEIAAVYNLDSDVRFCMDFCGMSPIEALAEWYNSNIILRDVALKAFTIEELESSFRDIKTFADACHVLDISFDANSRIADIIASTSKASAAMFKLNIISKAINLGQNLNFAKRSNLYYPCISLVSEVSFCLRKKLNSNEMQHIGIVESEGKEYHVISGTALYDYTTN